MPITRLNPTKIGTDEHFYRWVEKRIGKPIDDIEGLALFELFAKYKKRYKLDSKGKKKRRRNPVVLTPGYYDPEPSTYDLVRANLSRFRAGEETDAWGMSRVIGRPQRAVAVEHALKRLVSEGEAHRDGNWYGPVQTNPRRKSTVRQRTSRVLYERAGSPATARQVAELANSSLSWEYRVLARLERDRLGEYGAQLVEHDHRDVQGIPTRARQYRITSSGMRYLESLYKEAELAAIEQGMSEHDFAAAFEEYAASDPTDFPFGQAANPANFDAMWQRWRNGDENAFAPLARRHWNPSDDAQAVCARGYRSEDILRFVSGAGTEQWAEDLLSHLENDECSLCEGRLRDVDLEGSSSLSRLAARVITEKDPFLRLTCPPLKDLDREPPTRAMADHVHRCEACRRDRRLLRRGPPWRR